MVPLSLVPSGKLQGSSETFQSGKPRLQRAKLCSQVDTEKLHQQLSRALRQGDSYPLSTSTNCMSSWTEQASRPRQWAPWPKSSTSYRNSSQWLLREGGPSKRSRCTVEGRGLWGPVLELPCSSVAWMGGAWSLGKADSCERETRADVGLFSLIIQETPQNPLCSCINNEHRKCLGSFGSWTWSASAMGTEERSRAADCQVTPHSPYL